MDKKEINLFDTLLDTKDHESTYKYLMTQFEDAESRVDFLKSWCCGGKSSDLDFDTIRTEFYASRTCETVWAKEHVAYRCKTCGVSDSSCICVECFDPKEHEGHEFRMYKSSSGGCCDCGDPMAWNPSGFCKRHRENQSKDLDYAVRILPDNVKKGTESAMIFLVRYLLERCEELRTCSDRSIEDEEEELCYVRFLTEICGVCAGFRRILVRLLLREDKTFKHTLLLSYDDEYTKTNPCALKKLLLCLAAFKEKTTDAFAMMYLKLLFDPEFKIQFSDCFVRAYSSLMSKMSNAIQGIGYKSEESKAVNEFMDRIFVQLFANPSRVLEMTKKYRVPFIMLRSCDDLFREEISRFKDRKLIDSAIIRNRTYGRAFADMRT